MSCNLEFRSAGLVLLLAAASSCAGSASEDEKAPSADAGVPAVILDGGGGIEPSPNGPELCPAGECNYQTQDGCSDGTACRPAIVGQGDTSKVEPQCQSAGPGEPGDTCSSWLDCNAKSLCAEGTCRQLCCGGDWESCPDGNSCIRQLAIPLGSDSQDAGVSLCFPVNNCVLGDPLSCESRPGTECVIADPTGAVACSAAGDTAIGDPCAPDSPCKADQVCVGGHCRQLCRAVLPEPGDPRPCPEAESCIHFDRDPDGWGECTPYGAQSPLG